MITLTTSNFKRFRPLLSVPGIHTLSEKPIGAKPSPCDCSCTHGVTLIGTMLLGAKETGSTKDVHICNVCHCVLKDGGKTPVYGDFAAYMAEVVNKHKIVHLFFNVNAKHVGFLVTAMEAIHAAVNAKNVGSPEPRAQEHLEMVSPH